MEESSHAPDETTATGVALKFGFVHFGRFARQDRRSLGVRPSDTPGYDVIRKPG